jgi:predicted protein tyrosine phosphatase
MRVLFVCTANLDRSPAAEAVWRAIAGGSHESRSAGTSPTARRPLTAVDLDWADVVAVMEARHHELIAGRWPEHVGKVRVLDIPDRFGRDDPALRSALEDRLRGLLAERDGMIER